MKKNIGTALCLVAIGIGLAGAGVYLGDADDAPGAALLGFLLAIGTVTCAVKIARGHL